MSGPGRLEGNVRLLALFKLANVGLAMLWGFAVTFVFARLLPLGEFKAFLLLVAFANFTISADFGFSGIIYARLRPYWLGRTEQGDATGFDPAETGILFAFMLLAVLAGGALVMAGLATGVIPTGQPALFLSFYLLSALNILALLAKRTLAALDRNLYWESLDLVRRLASLALLFLSLGIMPVLLSVRLQIVLTALILLAALVTVHRLTGMRVRHWLGGSTAAWRAVRGYGRAMGQTMALTLSDVAAYHMPYLLLTLVTRDPRPVLVFDFLFKMSRALSAGIRALVESGLPRLTAFWHAGDSAGVQTRIAHLTSLGLGAAVMLGGFLIAAGPAISHAMFDGKAMLDRAELTVMALLFVGLSWLCVSTYVHNALGRFGVLLLPSFAFLFGSAASVGLAVLAERVTGADFTLAFLACYALVHCLVAVRHEGLLRGLLRP